MPKVWMRRLRNRPGKPWTVFWREGGAGRGQKGFGADKDAAAAFYGEKLRELGQAAPDADRDITVQDFGDRWLKSAARGLKRTTVATYTKLLKKHIYPALGGRRVRDIHQQHGLSFLAGKLETHAEGTVRTIYQVLRRLFARARFEGVIQNNPMRSLWVEMPVAMRSRRGGRDKSREEIQSKALTRAEVDALLREEARLGDRLFAVTYGCGLRIGEALGLQIDDVDLVHEELTVARRLEPPRVGVSLQDRVALPKGGVTRVHDIEPETLSVLARQVAWRRSENLRAGWTSPWLFVDRDGNPLDYWRLFLVFKKFLRRADVPTRYSPHGLRHSYVIHMLENGAPLPYVAKQIGDNLKTMLENYAAVLPKGDKRHARLLRTKPEALAQAIGGEGSHGGREPMGAEKLSNVAEMGPVQLSTKSVEQPVYEDKAPSETIVNHKQKTYDDGGCE